MASSDITYDLQDDEVTSLFEEWMVKHGKSYNSLGEKAKRFAIFKERFMLMEERNASQSHADWTTSSYGGPDYERFALIRDQYSDLTNEERICQYDSAILNNTQFSVREENPTHMEWWSPLVRKVKISDNARRILTQFSELTNEECVRSYIGAKFRDGCYTDAKFRDTLPDSTEDQSEENPTNLE